MAWGFPPSDKKVEKFIRYSNEQIVPVLKEILEELEFNIDEVSTYNIKANKKMPFTLFSALSFNRPYLNVFVMISEDGQVTLNTKYDYKSSYSTALSDSGKSKNINTLIINKLHEKIVRI